MKFNRNTITTTAAAALTCLAATGSHAAVLNDFADRAITGPHHTSASVVDRGWPNAASRVATLDGDILARANGFDITGDLNLVQESNHPVEPIGHHRIGPDLTTTELLRDEDLQRHGVLAAVNRPRTVAGGLQLVSDASNVLDGLNHGGANLGDPSLASVGDETGTTSAKAIVPVSGAEPILLLGAMTLVLRRNSRQEHETHRMSARNTGNEI